MISAKWIIWRIIINNIKVAQGCCGETQFNWKHQWLSFGDFLSVRDLWNIRSIYILLIRDSEVKRKSLSHIRLFATPWTVWATRLICPWNSPGRNTGMGSHSLLQGVFPTQGSDLGLLHCRQIIYHLSHQGSPYSKLKTHTDWKWGDSKHISCKQKWQESRDRNTHSEKIDFKTKSIKKAKVGHYIMIKGSVGDVTLIYMPACLC